MKKILKYTSKMVLPAVFLALIIALFMGQPVHAQQPPRPEFPFPPERPPMPDAPPPRPEIPAFTSHQNGNGNGAATGQIQVQTNPGANTVVQWQDGTGNWHDVDGWRTQSASGTVTWAVEEKDFGAGPFRWISYAHNGRIIAASHSFNLPKAGQMVSIGMGGQWQGGNWDQGPVYRRARKQPQAHQWSPPPQRQPQWQPRYQQRVHPHWQQCHPQWNRCHPQPRCGRYAHPQWHRHR